MPDETPNAIDSLSVRFRRSVKARGHFPIDQAALKHLYPAIDGRLKVGRK